MSYTQTLTEGPSQINTTRLRFPLACFVIALSAFTLLMVRASDAWSAFWPIISSYGLGVVSVLAVLMVAHFIMALLIQMNKNKSASHDEKVTWYKAYFKDIPWLNIASASGALIITTTSFTVHKGAVIGADGYGFDAMFIAWDRALFAGNDAWVISHQLFSSPTVTKWIDILYHPAFFPMLIGYLFCISARGKQTLRQTYMVSYLASFVLIGMISAGALHSAGPLFDGVLFGDGTTFAPLMDRLQDQLATGGGPQTADLIRQYLINLHQSESINMGAGISAMPSMHIVFAALWVFPAWHINRILGVFMTLYGILIWIGSVHLGWHYFVDGLVALAMIGVIWVCVGYLLGLYGKGQAIRATT